MTDSGAVLCSHSAFHSKVLLDAQIGVGFGGSVTALLLS